MIRYKTVFDVDYTVPGIHCWLKRHGFSYKKPSLVPGKANREQQEQWIEACEKLKSSLSKNETICFIDGVHPTHNTQLSYGWINTGVRKEIPANRGGSRLNLSSALDLISSKLHVQEDVTLNAVSTNAFLKKVESAYPTKNKLYVICDHARYYRNKDVTAYLEGSKVELHFLPLYSPNRNTMEGVWKWKKERVMYNIYYADFMDFRNAVLGFLQCVSGLAPDSILGKQFSSRIRDNFRAFDTPATVIKSLSEPLSWARCALVVNRFLSFIGYTRSLVLQLFVTAIITLTY